MHVLCTFCAWALVAASASAFQCSHNRVISPPPFQAGRMQPMIPKSHKHNTVLYQTDEPHDEDEYELVEFFVSPEQISLLRKEANKRDTRKKLPKVFLPPEESMEITSETITEISNLFETSELIEVRGVSRDKKKHVFDTAHNLALTVEDQMEKPVVVVDIKGFAVKLYCPWDDDQNDKNGGKKVELRSSYKPGQWTRKAKPLRDNRGQIITDENGKSIKEIPEY